MQKCKAQHNMVATQRGGWVARWVAGWLGGWAVRAPPPAPPLPHQTGIGPSGSRGTTLHRMCTGGGMACMAVVTAPVLPLHCQALNEQCQKAIGPVTSLLFSLPEIVVFP